jgi:hypothetical protein
MRSDLPRRVLTAAALSVLVLAGSGEASAEASVESRCPVPICGLSGTSWAEDNTDDQFFIAGEATVRWTFHRMDGKYAVYHASGTVTASWRHEGCSIDLVPAAHEFAPIRGKSDGELRIDFSQKPWRYHGGGGSQWEGTQIWCPGSKHEHRHEGVLATWFEGEGIVNAHPDAALKGRLELPHRKSTWKFVAH